MEDKPKRYCGEVISFGVLRHFGFISCSSFSEQIFVHIDDIVASKKAFKTLEVGEKVEFEVRETVRKGEKKLRAQNVSGINGSPVTGIVGLKPGRGKLGLEKAPITNVYIDNCDDRSKAMEMVSDLHAFCPEVLTDDKIILDAI